MKSSNPSLQELMNEMQATQESQEEETARLRRRLGSLESRRRELFDIVSLNSSDFETRRKLEETEKQIEEMHGILGRAEADLRSALQEIRQRILDLRNEELTRLEQESKALRQRKAEIHGELLPDAVARVASLREEEERLTQHVDEIARRIRELNQLDLPTSQVA